MIGALITLALSPIGRMVLVAVLTMGGMQYSYIKGRSAGKAACEKRHELARAAVEAELANQRREWDVAQRKDEDEAADADRRNDGIASSISADSDVCLGPRVLQRLQSLK